MGSMSFPTPRPSWQPTAWAGSQRSRLTVGPTGVEWPLAGGERLTVTRAMGPARGGHRTRPLPTVPRTVPSPQDQEAQTGATGPGTSSRAALKGPDSRPARPAERPVGPRPLPAGGRGVTEAGRRCGAGPRTQEPGGVLASPRRPDRRAVPSPCPANTRQRCAPQSVGGLQTDASLLRAVDFPACTDQSGSFRGNLPRRGNDP